MVRSQPVAFLWRSTHLVTKGGGGAKKLDCDLFFATLDAKSQAPKGLLHMNMCDAKCIPKRWPEDPPKNHTHTHTHTHTVCTTVPPTGISSLIPRCLGQQRITGALLCPFRVCGLKLHLLASQFDLETERMKIYKERCGGWEWVR